MFHASGLSLLSLLLPIALSCQSCVEAFTTNAGPRQNNSNDRTHNLHCHRKIYPSFSLSSSKSRYFGLTSVNDEVSTLRIKCGHINLLKMAPSGDNEKSGIVELADDDEVTVPATKTKSPTSVGPFLSQGEISDDALNPDFSDPKQTRVIIYIVLSLLPVLFLVPLMLGSRDLIPLDELPPVQM